MPPRGWRACATSATARTPPRAAVYDELYAEYRLLHDTFGRGANDAMKRLRAIRARTLAGAAGLRRCGRSVLRQAGRTRQVERSAS